MAQFTSSTFGNYAKWWLIGTGVFELLLAAGFLAGGLLVPGGEGGLLLTAAILGVTGLVLIVIGVRVARGAADAERIARTGIAGQATVTGLGQTGVSLNDQPQVEIGLMVNVPGRPPYPATRKEFVPLIMLGRLGSGLPLPVKVDPLDPSRVIIDWASAGIGAAPLGMQAGFAGMPPAPPAPPPARPMSATDASETLSAVQDALGQSGMNAAPAFAQAEQGQYTVEQLRDWLRQNGVHATATINRLRDSGRTIGDERLFTMQVTLNMPGRSPQELAESAAMVPLRTAPRIQLGQTLPVIVAADNPNMLMFDWDRV